MALKLDPVPGFLLMGLWWPILSAQAHRENVQGCLMQNWVKPSFDPQHLDDPHTFSGFGTSKAGSTAFAWPDANEIRFTLETRSPEQDYRSVALVQLAVKPTNVLSSELLNRTWDLSQGAGDPFPASNGHDYRLNCFVDRSEANPCRSGRQNPRCCYDPHATLLELQESYEECPYPCRQPCEAICYQSMVIQVELEAHAGGRHPSPTRISMVGRRIRLSQSMNRGPVQSLEATNVDQAFQDVVALDLQPQYHASAHMGLGSLLNHEFATGYWIRWRPKQPHVRGGPWLELGWEGANEPYLVHAFHEHCFDCQRGDHHGWRGADVQLPRMVSTFEPEFWAINGVFGGSEVRAGTNCSTFVGQETDDQTELGGVCVSNEQCMRWCQSRDPYCLNRKCRRHLKGLQSTCQLLSGPHLPWDIWIVIIGMIPNLVAFVIWSSLAIYYLGSINPRKKKMTQSIVTTQPVKE